MSCPHDQCKAIIDELERMQVFYVNIGGGEPTVRPGLLGAGRLRHRAPRGGEVLHQRCASRGGARLAASDYVDVQISLDGATAEVNDAVRGQGSFDMATRAAEPGRCRTRAEERGRQDLGGGHPPQRRSADDFKALADQYAHLRITWLRPSGRGADVWDELHPTPGPAGAALRLAGGPRRAGAHR